MLRSIPIYLSLALLSTCGCVQYASLLKINADGSGTLVIRDLMSEDTKKILGLGILKSKSDEPSKETNKADEKLASLAKSYKENITRLGEGVSFVQQEIIAKKGWKGVQTTYAFEDINKLTLANIRPRKKDDDAQENKDKSSDFAGTQRPFQFELKKGNTNELIISVAPEPKKTEEPDDPFAEAGIELKEAPASNLSIGNALAVQFAKAALQGARITSVIKINGTVTATNSPYQTQPDTIVLQDFDLGEFAGSEQFERAINEKWDFARLVEEKVPGLKATAPDQQLRIKFTAD